MSVSLNLFDLADLQLVNPGTDKACISSMDDFERHLRTICLNLS
jgi:hypothetical protein